MRPYLAGDFFVAFATYPPRDRDFARLEFSTSLQLPLFQTSSSLRP